MRACAGRAFMDDLRRGPNPLRVHRNSVWEDVKPVQGRLRQLVMDRRGNVWLRTLTHEKIGCRIMIQGGDGTVGTITSNVLDWENRLSAQQTGSGYTTHTYDGDGLSRTKKTATAFTTFVWDYADYLGEYTT